MQDIALVDSCPATFQSPYKERPPPANAGDPRQCVLLRAGGHLSVLDMDQGQNACRLLVTSAWESLLLQRRKCSSCTFCSPAVIWHSNQVTALAES